MTLTAAIVAASQGWAQGSFVEAEAEVEAEARQSEIKGLCRFNIMHNAHVVVNVLALWSMTFINEKHYREVS